MSGDLTIKMNTSGLLQCLIVIYIVICLKLMITLLLFRGKIGQPPNPIQPDTMPPPFPSTACPCPSRLLALLDQFMAMLYVSRQVPFDVRTRATLFDQTKALPSAWFWEHVQLGDRGKAGGGKCVGDIFTTTAF